MSRNETAIKCLPQPAGLALVYARESATYSKKAATNNLRLVTGEQEIEVSLDTQVKGILRLAEEHNYTVHPGDVFKERFTGFELYDRELLTEVRRRIASREYAALLCHSTDRLARKASHLQIIAEECARYEIELLFVTEPLDNSPEGALIRYVRGYAAEVEREKIRERTMRGRLTNISANAFVAGGKAMYGYTNDKTTRKRVIDPTAAKIVRMIFDLNANQGRSLTWIANHLNERGVLSPAAYKGINYKDGRANNWTDTRVGSIVKDPTYTGRTFVDRYKNTDKKYYTKERPGKPAKAYGRLKQRRTAQTEWTELKGCTPAIIDVEIFERAQRAIAANDTGAVRTRNEKEPYLLRGLAYCTECGSKMYPCPSRTFGRRQYRCCDRPNCGVSVNADRMEALVWKNVLTYFTNPELIEFHLRKARKDSKATDLYGELAAIDEQIKKFTTAAQRITPKLTEAVTEGDDILIETYEASVKTYTKQIKGLKSDREEVVGRLAAIKSAENVLDKFKQHCAVIRARMESDLSFEAKIKLCVV